MHGRFPTHRFQTQKQAIAVKQIDRFSILVLIKINSAAHTINFTEQFAGNKKCCEVFSDQEDKREDCGIGSCGTREQGAVRTKC